MTIKRLNTLQKDNDIIDLTYSVVDYLLRVGDTAIINFNDVNTIPLHVATEEGEYEVKLFGDDSVTATSGDLCYLLPNNGVVSGIQSANQQQQISSGSLNNFTGSTTQITIGQSRIVYMDARISTFTKGKSWKITTNQFYYNNSGYFRDYWSGIWVNTTTIWSSLGTITLSNNQSGKIIIKRLA